VWLTPVVNLVPLTVDGTIGVVSSLMMKWDAKLSLLHLRHLRLRAWSSRQISVSSNRSKVRGSSGEVVLRKRGDVSADAASVMGRVMIGFVSTGVE
jgi:hypothetical protein